MKGVAFCLENFYKYRCKPAFRSDPLDVKKAAAEAEDDRPEVMYGARVVELVKYLSQAF